MILSMIQVGLYVVWLICYDTIGSFPARCSLLYILHQSLTNSHEESCARNVWWRNKDTDTDRMKTECWSWYRRGMLFSVSCCCLPTMINLALAMIAYRCIMMPVLIEEHKARVSSPSVLMALLSDSKRLVALRLWEMVVRSIRLGVFFLYHHLYLRLIISTFQLRKSA